ncbi:hypothetical protein SNE40_013725 [Patella caerulea]|uniref:F5/8 type C domain-containing protein n=1 Tax=Patella caerulea TaxID=87958 RepID=A0AAN8JC57_PATCE
MATRHYRLPGLTYIAIYLGCLIVLNLYPGTESIRCQNGKENTSGECKCFPCWKGASCEEKVNKPLTFEQKNQSVSLESNYKENELIYVAIADDPDLKDTCQDGVSCPCGQIEYSIISGNEENLFTVDRDLGIVRLNGKPVVDINPDGYHLVLLAKNTFAENDMDRMNLEITVKKHSSNLYTQEAQRGYEDASYVEGQHHRVKRAATDTPSNVTFDLQKLTAITDVYVGHRIQFKLTIMFPAGTTDMLVELFTPDNNTIIMMLCNVKVERVGSNLAYTGAGDIKLESKNNSIFYDWAVIDFGNVTNNDAADSEHDIVITYEAVMIQNDATVVSATYWISAGAEFNDENEVWIGQASVNPGATDPYDYAANRPVFTFNGPSVMEAGSSAIFTVDMTIKTPSIGLGFDAFAPMNNTSVMTICGVQIQDVGEHYSCGFDYTAVPSTLHADGQPKGNARGHLDIGVVTNKGIREGNDSHDKNHITVQIVVKVWDDAVPSTDNWIGAALELGSDQIWCGQYSVQIVAKTVATVPLPSLTITPPAPVDVSVKNAALIDIEFLVPLGTSDFKLDFKSPESNGKSILNLCALIFVSSGENLPCVDKDKVAEYVSLSGDTSARNEAVLDLGVVTNVGDWGYLNVSLNDTKNTIKVRLAVKGTDHPLFTVSSAHTIEIGLTRDGTRQTVGSGIATAVVADQNLTEIAVTPPMNLSYKYSSGNVRVNEAVTVLYEITTPKDETFPMFDMEFIAPNSSDTPKVSICRAEVHSVGKNIPCMTKDGINSKWQYLSQFNVTKYDRATLSLDSVCNFQIEANETEDKFVLAGVFKLENHPSISAGDSMYLSAGSMYTSTKMWVAQLTLTVDGSALPAPVTPLETFVIKSDEFAAGDSPVGYPGKYELTIKTVPGQTVDLTVTITSTSTSLSICNIRIKSKGYNLPCVDTTINKDVVVTEDPATGLKNQAVLALGYVTNVGDTASEAGNSTFDENTLLLEITVQSKATAAPGSLPFTVAATNTDKATAATQNHDVIASQAGIDANVTNSSSIVFTTAAVVETDDDNNVSPGQAKRFFIDVNMPEDNIQKVTVELRTGISSYGQFEVVYIGLFETGANIVCLTREMTTATYTSRLGTYNDVGTLDIGFACNIALDTENTEANRIRVEAYVRMLNNDSLTDGMTVSLNAAVNFNDQQIFISQKQLTVKSVASFSDLMMDNLTLTNASVISLNSTVASPIVMNIAEVKTIPILISIPPFTVSKVQFDVDLPVTPTSASITYKSLKIVSSGPNLCKYGYEEDFKITTVSSQNTTQINKVYVDMNIVSNIGVTHRQNRATPEDDILYMELEVQMADSTANDHEAELWIGLGTKVATIIVISEYKVKVTRSGSEQPVFNLTATYDAASSTSTLVELNIQLEHSDTSKAEMQNMILKLNVPPYLTYKDVLSINPTAPAYTSSLIGDNAVEMLFDKFFFTDSLEMNISLEVNTTYKVPQGVVTTAAVTGVECVANVIARTLPTVLDGTKDYSSGFKPVNFTLTTTVDSGTPCTATPLTNVVACLLTSQGDDISGPENGLIGSGTADGWVPPVRDGKLGLLRYIQINLAGKARLTQIGYEHTKTDKVTKLKVKYSDDGLSWNDGEEVTLNTGNGNFQGSISSAYIRFYVIETSAPSVEVGLKFSFTGCYDTATVATACPTAATAPAEYARRTFVVDDTHVYVCDGSLGSDGNEIIQRCYSSQDGDKWTELDSRVHCMVGFHNDVKGAKVYALSSSPYYSYMVSDDKGMTWMSVNSDRMNTVKTALTYTPAVKVPWINNVNLDSMTLTQGSWGAKYEGMQSAAVTKFKWDSCCP